MPLSLPRKRTDEMSQSIANLTTNQKRLSGDQKRELKINRMKTEASRQEEPQKF